MRITTLALIAAAALLLGCSHPPEITAVPASPFNQGEPPGMPFYLPKPLLVVSKNVRHIDEAKVGLTQPATIPNAFDDQAGYGDLKANVTSPGSVGSKSLGAANTGGIAREDKYDDSANGLPQGWRGAMTPPGRVQDSLAPDSFYTYQIIFVPDLGQKYGLRIKGKPGEVRAAMNLVNGWMYTGMGPYYLKDSSTAQNMMAAGVATMFAGRAAADVLDSVAGLASAAGSASGAAERAVIDSDTYIDRVTQVAKVLRNQTLIPREMVNYAEVTIYEPQLNPAGGMDWGMIAQHAFNRQYFSPDMDETTAKLLTDTIRGLADAADDPIRNLGEDLQSRPPNVRPPIESSPMPERTTDELERLPTPRPPR